MHKTTNLQAPQKIDWRDLGGVTEVNYDNNAQILQFPIWILNFGDFGA